METPFDRYVRMYNGRLPTERDPNYLELLNMSKYLVEPYPKFKPSKCANCGSSKEDGRKYVSFGLELDWYGVVYLCTLCLKDVAESAGLFDSHLAELRAVVAELKDARRAERQESAILHKLESLSEEIKDYYDASVCPTCTSGASDGLPLLDADASSAESGTDASEQGTVKQDSSERSKDIPSLTDLFKL